MSNKKFTSILDDLCGAPRQDNDLFIESRAMQVIASFDNLMTLLEETYDEDLCADLQKRLMLSIRNRDGGERFSRKIQGLRKK